MERKKEARKKENSLLVHKKRNRGSEIKELVKVHCRRKTPIWSFDICSTAPQLRSFLLH